MHHAQLIAFVVAILASTALAQNDIQSGTIKSVDADRGTIVLTVKGEDREFTVSARTRIWDGRMRELPDRLSDKGFKAGAAVQFRADGQGGLQGLKLSDAAPINVDTSKLKPLPELGKEKYQGFQGGLYPDGQNERPKSHEEAGLKLAKAVQPLDAEGRPSPDGKIVLLSVGMSNTSQVFGAFKSQADADRQKNPQVVIVNGAQGGMTAFRIQDPEDNASGTQYWTTTDRQLRNAGVTPAQVQAVWIKQADAGPRDGFPKYAQTLQAELARIVQILPKRYPNVKLCYLSGRTYGGYAKTGLNPDPYAYESGFSVKWLIEDQLKGEAPLNFDPDQGDVKAPWLAWGPYLWANGTTKNADGLSYEPADFGNDGTHPSRQGQQKVGEYLLKFFKTDATAKVWFVAD